MGKTKILNGRKSKGKRKHNTTSKEEHGTWKKRNTK